MSLIEKPDDLQSIANHPVFFVYMTIFVYNGNNRKETVNKLNRRLPRRLSRRCIFKLRKFRTKSSLATLVRKTELFSKTLFVFYM